MRWRVIDHGPLRPPAVPISLRLRSWVVVAFLAWGIGSCRSPQIPHPQQVWSVDLGSDAKFRSRLSVSEVSLLPPSIGFLGDSKIICGFYGSNPAHAESPLPFSEYHILEIDAGNGSLGQRLDFNAYEEGYRALPVADGGFVVLANDKLTRFNDQFVAGSSLPTPRVQAGKTFDRWLTDTSPDGGTLVLYSHQPGSDLGSWTWMRTSDLSRIRTIEVPQTFAIRASNAAGIYLHGQSEVLIAAGKPAVICTLCNAYFLNESLLFVDSGTSYAIQTTSGEKRWNGDHDVGSGEFTRAAHATRIAYVTGHYAGSGFPIQTHFDSITAKVVVLDWATNKVISEIDINEPAGNPSAGLSQMALALSPDGRTLAVLLHHTLTLYRFP